LQTNHRSNGVSTRIRALIVDDEPWARRRLSSLVKAERDFEVIGECGDGREAVDAIRLNSPDVVFLDVQMPRMGGFEALRALDPSRIPHIVFVTAYEQTPSRLSTPKPLTICSSRSNRSDSPVRSVV
jgi:DNA-binding NarL/FixJ family response regulator